MYVQSNHGRAVAEVRVGVGGGGGGVRGHCEGVVGGGVVSNFRLLRPSGTVSLVIRKSLTRVEENLKLLSGPQFLTDRAHFFTRCRGYSA